MEECEEYERKSSGSLYLFTNRPENKDCYLWGVTPCSQVHLHGPFRAGLAKVLPSLTSKVSRIKFNEHNIICRPGSSVCIATDYGLDGPGIEFRWGARFSAPVQIGPGAHLASCTRSTGSLPGVNSGRDVTLTPHNLLLPWS